MWTCKSKRKPGQSRTRVSRSKEKAEAGLAEAIRERIKKSKNW